MIISFKSLSALDFKIILNIILYIPVVSRNIPRAKEPTSTSSTVCETSIWFHAFKKTRNGAVKKNIFLFLLCASCLMLVHKYCIRPLKFFFFVYHDFNHVAFVQHFSSKGLNIVSLRNVISASVEHVSIISFFNKAQHNVCELKKKLMFIHYMVFAGCSGNSVIECLPTSMISITPKSSHCSIQSVPHNNSFIAN